MPAQTPLFDTHEFIEDLTSSGSFERKQAEDLTKALNKALTSGVATSSDIAQLSSDITQLESRLETRIVDSKVDILKWTTGTMLVVGGFIYAAIKDYI